jgi:hypothetical protein
MEDRTRRPCLEVAFFAPARAAESPMVTERELPMVKEPAEDEA